MGVTVDEFVSLRPDLIFLSLDIPSMDGHLAALEMRETDYEARIVIVSSRQRLTTARNAAYSAGAVAVLETPLTQSVFDENWVSMMGDIPPAPGLADLDVDQTTFFRHKGWYYDRSAASEREARAAEADAEAEPRAEPD